MKKFTSFYLTCIILLFALPCWSQVGIGTASPNSSSVLDLSSNSKGLLIPRMTTTARNAIASPAEGLVVYDTDIKSQFIYTGNAWKDMAAGSSKWGLNGTHIYNNYTGNVGIGTSNPSYDLQITRPSPSIGFHDTQKQHLSGYIIGDSTNLQISAYRHLFLPGGTETAGNILLQPPTTSGIPLRAGNVGIGKTDAPYRLSVAGDVGLYQSSTVYGSMEASSGNFLINAAKNSPVGEDLLLQYAVYGAPPALNVGNVGIGVPATEGKLHVSGFNDTKLVLGRSHTAGGHTALYMGTSNLSGGYSYLQGIRSAGSAYGNLMINSWGGNIGVGTFNPIAKLHINGSGELVRVSNGNVATQIFENGFQFLNSSGIGRFFMDFSNDHFTISPSSGNNAGRLYLNGNQVVIGQMNPATGYKLSIGGKAICEELKVQLVGSWPDYVFNKNYKLRSFDELRAYLNENNHLPDIPAAAQLEKNGIEVGDMQRRMMEKIEELTLYVLQLEAELKEVKKIASAN